MWQTQTTEVPGGRHYRVTDGDDPLPMRQFFRLLASDDAFIDWYSATLTEFESVACYWELPPLTADTLGNDTEFVLLEASMLARFPPEPDVFATHFRSRPSDDVIVFPNLGGDATLIVPSPRTADHVYPHLLSFLRGAPREQIQSFWRVTAVTLEAQLHDLPTWLSTAGGGVAWLHLRLDSRPKYYQFAPYRSFG